jgi:hypothetical protein
MKKQRNLTFDNAIQHDADEIDFFGKFQKVQIIDTMIDGLQRLKTLVIEEEKNKVELPKIVKKQSLKPSDSRNKISPAKEKNERINSNQKIEKKILDKNLLEISKILETENENETPKNVKNIKITKKKVDETPQTIKAHTNLFKVAIKRGKISFNSRDSQMNILNDFSKNVNLLTQEMISNSNNVSNINMKSSNENSFIGQNAKKRIYKEIIKKGQVHTIMDRICLCWITATIKVSQGLF